MIRKRRTKSYPLLCYEALFRRLKENYRQSNTINQNYVNHLSGFLGERQVDYILHTYAQKDFDQYQDLRLQVNGHNFQMDTLLMNRTFILILEIKNWKGELIYDSKLNNVIQIYNNTEKSYQNPISQVQSHVLQLNYWLQQNLGIYGIPIESLVVISDPTTIIKNPDNDSSFYEKVIYAENLPSKIDELKMRYNKNLLSQEKLDKLNNGILKGNSPYRPDLIQTYQIQENHFIDGIECEQCGHFPMTKNRRKWICENCYHTDKTAHIRALFDYFLLFQRTISNKECREYLQLDSIKSAYLLLQSLNVKQTGNNRGRIYHAPELEAYPQQSFVPNKKKEVLLF